VEPDPGVAEALQRVAAGIPVVTLLPVPAAGVDCVTVDRAHGVHLAARHLIGLGHRRLGAIMPFDRGRAAAENAGSPPPAPSLHPHVHQRLVGLRRACREAGCPLDEGLVSYQAEGTYDGGYAGARALWQRCPRPPTALLCSNDQTAIGALLAFQEMGVRVPAEVALVGFDNLPEAAYARVPLTTLAQPVEEEAQRAVSLLFERLRAPERRKEVVTVSLPPQLIVRQSCGASPAAEKENGSQLDPHPSGRGDAMQPLPAPGAKRR
jgi:LacI family transcriptional regulator